MISKILVPTDGSRTAQKATMYAVDLAKQLNVSVIVLSVIDIRSLMNAEYIKDYLREAAEEYVGKIKKLCDKKGVRSKTVITTGHPVEGIVKEAERSNVNLIIMGSHGKSALAAAILGGVAYGVIHKDTKIPVMVVKR